MIFVRTDSFRRDFQSLPQDLQARTEKALHLLAENARHLSLRVKEDAAEEQRHLRGARVAGVSIDVPH